MRRLLIACLIVSAPTVRADDLQYNRDIRPILANHCFTCHGPAAAAREADLRLDEREAAIESGVLVPGEPENSEILRRISSEDHDELMPPPEMKKPLSESQKERLREWVEQGAPYEDHWSFLAPQRPKLPATDPASWAHNPIDLFVLRRLQAEGLQPSSEAARATLIRRVCFDLNGLPPTLEELDRFLSDDSPYWYERVVDHYLSQPAFGERMALAWMDAARYGDTSVFHADGPRDMWPWRDWVINAYNSNMPFDQFTVEQLAGDLLPNATASQQIASGFNRNHGTTDEGGAIAEEYRVEYVVDRVQTTSNVWLGISMECAQCHEHKYDPISQKEYYGFYAFFNRTTDPGMQTRDGNQSPVVEVPDPERDMQVTRLEELVRGLDQELEDRKREIEPEFTQWLAQAEQEARAGEEPTMPLDLFAHFPLDESQGSATKDTVSGTEGTVQGKALWVEGKIAGGFQIDAENFLDCGNVGDFDSADKFSYGCWIKPTGTPTGVPIGKMNEGNRHRGWDLYVANGQVAVHLIHQWSEKAIKITTKTKVPADEWTHVFATYDGSQKASGVKIYFNGVAQEYDVNADSLTGSMKTTVPLKIGRRHTSSPFKGIVDDVRVFDRTLSDTEVASIANGSAVHALLVLDAGERTDDQAEQLRTHFLRTVDKPYQDKLTAQQAHQDEVARLRSVVLTSMIMEDQGEPRETYLLMRGHYASPDKSEVIQPDVPAAFPPLPDDAPRNRLGLARWLTAPEHPLTSRVAVNRYWTMLFGRGIVSTPMDFGSQGAWPTHPELLDWLADDFLRHGWDVKRTLKQMLMSATYRQSSRATPDLQTRDPQNELLARGPRFRLQGEVIRDTALAVAGILEDELGGPGVKPYQPPGLWNEVSLSGNVRFVQDSGEKLYRKSMYIYWKRSAPHPGMLIFDAPTREKCAVERPRTNTPLQALYTLNDVQFVEAARMLAARMAREGGSQPSDRIRFGYRLLTANYPSNTAQMALLKLYETERARFESDEEAAKALLDVGDFPVSNTTELSDLAAWTVVANVLLNMDATLTKY